MDSRKRWIWHSTNESTYLEVEYKGKNFLFRKRCNAELLAVLVEAIGADRVCKLGLKAGQHYLVTRVKVYDTQAPCGNLWCSVPNEMLYRYKMVSCMCWIIHYFTYFRISLLFLPFLAGRGMKPSVRPVLSVIAWNTEAA